MFSEIFLGSRKFGYDGFLKCVHLAAIKSMLIKKLELVQDLLHCIFLGFLKCPILKLQKAGLAFC